MLRNLSRQLPPRPDDSCSHFFRVGVRVDADLGDLRLVARHGGPAHGIVGSGGDVDFSARGQNCGVETGVLLARRHALHPTQPGSERVVESDVLMLRGVSRIQMGPLFAMTQLIETKKAPAVDGSPGARKSGAQACAG